MACRTPAELDSVVVRPHFAAIDLLVSVWPVAVWAVLADWTVIAVDSTGLVAGGVDLRLSGIVVVVTAVVTVGLVAAVVV